MPAAIRYISLNNGLQTWRILTDPDSHAGGKEGLFITSVSGLFEPGENTEGSTPRSDEDGSILVPNPTLAGKNIKLGLYCGGLNQASAMMLYQEFIEFLKPLTFILDSDWVGPYTVQYASFNLDSDGHGTDGYFAGSIVLMAKEAW